MNFVSFNVNGLRDVNKRRSVFNFLKTTNANIVLLQETHSSIDDETIWSNEWGNKIIFSHCSNRSKGVALLFQRGFRPQIHITRLDLNGRFLLLELTLVETKFLLVNIYAPNEDDPSFFDKIFDMIEIRDNNSLILAGDFNTTLDQDWDLYNNAGLNHVKKRNAILEYMENKGLVDVF